MVFVFGNELNNKFALTVVLLLAESYLAIDYTKQNDEDYKYDDNRRLIIGVVCLATVFMAVVQLEDFDVMNIQSVLILFSTIGSAIIAFYFLSPNSETFKTDWKRKFVTYFYYGVIALTAMAVIGFKSAEDVAEKIGENQADAVTKVLKGTNDVSNAAIIGTQQITKDIANATGEVVKGAVDTTEAVVKGAVDTTKAAVEGVGKTLDTSLNTAEKITSQAVGGVADSYFDSPDASSYFEIASSYYEN